MKKFVTHGMLGVFSLIGISANATGTCPALREINYQLSEPFVLYYPGEKEGNNCFEDGLGEPNQKCFFSDDVNAKDKAGNSWLVTAYTYADSDDDSMAKFERAIQLINNEDRQAEEMYGMCHYKVNAEVGITYFKMDDFRAVQAQDITNKLISR